MAFGFLLARDPQKTGHFNEEVQITDHDTRELDEGRTKPRPCP